MSDSVRSKPKKKKRATAISGSGPRRPALSRKGSIAELKQYLHEAHKVCRRVVAEYLARSLKPRALPRSARDLHVIIKEIYAEAGNGEIVVDMLLENEKYEIRGVFRGFIIRRRGRGPQIVLNPYQDRNERRVALVQESFQALLDYKELRAKQLAPAISDFLDYRKSFQLDRAKRPTYGELIAEVVTMEALFPYKHRVRVLKTNEGDKLSAEQISDLGKTYGIPESLIRCYLSKSTMRKLAPFHRKAKVRARRT